MKQIRMRGYTRLCVLLLVLVMLNGIDLYLTVFHVNHFHFEEANPIADIVLTNGILAMIWFKLMTTFIASICLAAVWLRRPKYFAKVCWFCIFMFVLLSIYWGHYTHEIIEASSSK